MLATGYLTRLGNFVETFAEVEETLHAFLIQLAGLDRLTAVALLSGTRINTDMEFVGRLYDARQTKMPPALKKAFDQLTQITAVRNQILHHGSIPWSALTENGWVTGRTTSNASRRLRDPKRYQVSADLLGKLIGDLGSIYMVMTVLAGTNRVEGSTPEEYLQRFEQTAWHCKFPLPEHGQEPRSDNRRTRKPRPQS